MAKPRIMFNMTVEEVRDGLNECKSVILPVGVVEQHGYHLPLSVDTHNAEQISQRASEINGCFVAPCLNYCFSGGTLPGTINISPSTFTQVLMDIFLSLARQGFANIIVLLGHGGTESTQAAKDAALMFQRIGSKFPDIAIAVVGFWELSPTYLKAFEEHDFHAGKYETSLMLYWKPELVKMDKLQMDKPEFAQLMREDQDAYLSIEHPVDSPFVIPRYSQSERMKVGVMGIPEEADAALGETIAKEASEGLAELIDKLEARLKKS